MSALRTGVLLLAAAILVIAAGVAEADARRPEPGAPEQGGAVPGQLVVRLTATAHASVAYRADLGAAGRTGLPALDAVLAELDAVRVEPLLKFPAQAATPPGLSLNRTLLVRYAGAEKPEVAVARFAAAAEVELAAPDGYVYAQGLIPDDPVFPDQWAHRNTGQAISHSTGSPVGTPDFDTDTDTAWDLTTGSSSILIAIIDSGVDPAHPEFAGRLLLGYDFVNDDYDASDDRGHGTACAGIAAGAGNNGLGIAGVAWQSRLLPVKVLNSAGLGTVSWIINGIVWAVDQGADILSLSLGSPGPEDLYSDPLQYAYGQGRAIFCAAGNDDDPTLVSPAIYSAYTIPIGALSPCGGRKTPTSCDGEDWWGSNHTTACLFAPGVRIATTDITGAGGYDPGYVTMDFNGTSSATPHAAGIGALVLALNPALSPEALENVLKASCVDLGAAGVDSDTGWGALNAQLAVLSAFALPYYCRSGYVGVEYGSLHKPFNTFPEGVAAVPAGRTLIVFGGSYGLTAPLTLSAPMTIRGFNGTAVIAP